MRSWDTNPSNNFCDPYWELLCCNKWHPGISGMSTPAEFTVGTHFHMQHGTKTTPVFLSVDGEAFWLLLPSSVSLLPCGTVQPENAYSCILKVIVMSEKARKGQASTLITVITSVHLPKTVSTNVALYSVLTNTIGNDGVPGWSM